MSLNENHVGESHAGECEDGWHCKKREECLGFKEKQSNLEALTSFTPEWFDLASELADLKCNGEKNWVCCETGERGGGLHFSI